ncbi:MAG: hypothetical protein ABIJ28_00560 [Patescibacteria group bacterium]
MGKTAVGDMSDWSGLLKDFFRQIDDGTITRVKIEAIVNNKVVYPKEVAEHFVLNDLLRKTQKLLSRRFGKRIKADPLPAEFTPENLEKWEKFNLKPIFLPDEEISESRPLKNWIKPEKWFYQKIKEGKIPVDSAKLNRGWYLADFTPSVDYTDGTQVYANDPLAPIIERLRKEGIIGKNNETPTGSRFAIVPKDEWPILLDELATKLGFESKQVGLERAIEFNAIGNLYDSNRGKFNTWEWFTDPFGDFYRLYGGFRGYGGLSYVYYNWSDFRNDAFSGRPLVSFV